MWSISLYEFRLAYVGISFSSPMMVTSEVEMLSILVSIVSYSGGAVAVVFVWNYVGSYCNRAVMGFLPSFAVKRDMARHVLGWNRARTILVKPCENSFCVVLFGYVKTTCMSAMSVF